MRTVGSLLRRCSQTLTTLYPSFLRSLVCLRSLFVGLNLRDSVAPVALRLPVTSRAAVPEAAVEKHHSIGVLEKDVGVAGQLRMHLMANLPGLEDAVRHNLLFSPLSADAGHYPASGALRKYIGHAALFVVRF